MIVEIAVIDTDNATSLFAYTVKRFEVVPPGTQPTTSSEIAMAGGNARTFASEYAMSGIHPNCDSSPTSGANRRRTMSRKLATPSPAPIPNIRTNSSAASNALLTGPSTRRTYPIGDRS